MAKHSHAQACPICGGETRPQAEKRVVARTTFGTPLEVPFSRQICAGKKQSDCTWASAWVSPALDSLREQAKQNMVKLYVQYAGDAEQPAFSRDDARRLANAEQAAYDHYREVHNRWIDRANARQAQASREAREAWEAAKRELKQAQAEYPAYFAQFMTTDSWEAAHA